MADNFLSPDGRHYASEDTLLPLERNWFGRMALRFERLTGIDFIDKSAEVERLLIDGEGGPIFDRSGLVLWSAESSRLTRRAGGLTESAKETEAHMARRDHPPQPQPLALAGGHAFVKAGGAQPATPSSALTR